MEKKLNILYEDSDFIAINKKAGEIIQADKTGDKPLSETISEYLTKKQTGNLAPSVGIVHRIDRPASGLAIFALNEKSLALLNQIFQNREIAKSYLAVVKAEPRNKSGHLVNFLIKNEKTNRSLVVSENIKNAQKAELRYETIAETDSYFLLKIDLITGRHHQIRAQLAHMGCPLIGDNKYGYKRSNKDRSIHLHSYEMSFIHPITKVEINIKAPLPQDVIWDRFKM